MQLVEFAEFYKRVAELSADERPDDETIQNDAELDRYLDNLNRQRAQKLVRR